MAENSPELMRSSQRDPSEVVSAKPLRPRWENDVSQRGTAPPTTSYRGSVHRIRWSCQRRRAPSVKGRAGSTPETRPEPTSSRRVDSVTKLIRELDK